MARGIVPRAASEAESIDEISNHHSRCGNCRPAPYADAALHQSIAHIGEGVEPMKAEGGGQGVAKVVIALNDNGEHFAHSGWRPVSGNHCAQVARRRRKMKLEIPKPMVEEHEALHAELRHATGLGGATGEAARTLSKIMHPHFVKEDQYALPPLGLLGALARGKASSDMRKVLGLTDRLKAELPEMLAEHRAIVAALDRLAAAARAEHHEEAVAFVHELRRHAQTQEQVAYPAAIIVGEYVRRALHL